jgi:hypothetical protein
MKKLAVTISGVAVALVATGVAYCPYAAAAPACPYDMNTEAGRDAFQQAIVGASQQVGQDQQAYGVNGNAALAANDAQIQRDSSNMVLACQGMDSPALPPLPPSPVQSLPPGVDPGLAAINATGDPTVGQAPNCADYVNKYDGMPAGVDNAMSAASLVPGAPEIPGPSDVLLTCGLANSVLAVPPLLSGDIPEFLERGRQATIGDCWVGQHAIPFVTLPGNCGG